MSNLKRSLEYKGAVETATIIAPLFTENTGKTPNVDDIMPYSARVLNAENLAKMIADLKTGKSVATQPNIGRELFDVVVRGNTEFQEKTGRPLTYSEMRALYG